MSDYIKEKVEEFNKLFCDIYPGDSGLGGNDPQEPVDDWACYPSDVRKWLKNSLQEMEERTREELREKIVDLPKMYWGLAGESPTPRYVSFDDVLSLLSQKKESGEKCGCEADEWGIEHTISAHEGHLPKKEDK